ncbi:MAG: starch phosphorylase [Saprospiraceae bacterium]
MNHKYTWAHPYTPDKKYSKRVVYLSMEFGIGQPLKTYSGGLGYLAGSHMQSAAQIKQNLIGVGMLWNYGYYDQVRDKHNHMKTQYTKKFYSYLEDTGIVLTVKVKGHEVKVKAYYLKPETFGTVPMYFLTTDIQENDDLARSITKRLYDSNESTRVAQSIVLGIGGAKLVEVLGGSDIFHMNEAHSLPVAFHLLEKYGSMEEVKKRLVFTTHTPVMAGNAVHDIHLLNEMGFFGNVNFEEARNITGMHEDHFEYTPAALRMAKVANGVSQLHGEVAREMWSGYDRICEIKAITNAQDEIYWQDNVLKAALDQKDDQAYVARKKAMKKELFKIVADQTGDIFDENILTIVWARRFAGYKRADLIMRDMERFERMLNQSDYPVQIIWAGKPYPEDYGAVALFNKIKDISYRYKNMAILTGYELELSAALKKGSDLWLNTPRRPKEASGTSGMTAAMNGSINLSTQDGWIPEFFKDKENSFVLPIADLNQDENGQDTQDHESLLSLLENEIAPMYYEHPERWITIMKNSMLDVSPMFDSKRMADEYYAKVFND